MSSLTSTSHITIVAASLEKIYNKSRLRGELPSTDLYTIEAMDKFLSTCVTSLTDDQKRKLFSLYNTTINTSENICKIINIVPNIIQKKSGFTQGGEDSNTTAAGPYNTIFNNVFE